MKTQQKPRVANSILPIATFCLLLSACKKDDEPSSIPVNNDIFNTVEKVSTAGSPVPSSAVPDASGQFIYFTSFQPGKTGVYKLPSAGGTTTDVFTGSPLGKPIDLALSTDNQTVYVADGGANVIYALSIHGGVPAAVAGTAGTAPISVDVIRRGGADVIYFGGTNPADGQPAIFEIAAGGAPAPILRYKGSPLTAVSGIVSAKDGTLYIADQRGRAHKLTSSNTLTQIADGIVMGTPAGIALTPDDNAVAISSKNAGDGTAQVHVINLQTGAMSIFNKVIGANSGPGGLHAARDAAGGTGTYAWADLSAGTAGTVYRVQLK